VHIIGLYEHDQCRRYRLEAYRQAWEADGHRLDVQPIAGGFWGRLCQWRALRSADVVILQRRLFSDWHLLCLRRNVRQLVFDFDDAVFERNSFSGKQKDNLERRRRFVAALHAADWVVAGNAFLAREALRFRSSARVRVVPTCLDTAKYRLACHQRRGEGVELVWIGRSKTLRALEERMDLMAAIGSAFPHLRCRIICDRFPRFENLHVLDTEWSEETEAEALAASDIGISWLPPDRWSEGKCGLKVLQYMAAGLPVVANRVGVQTELVRDGETGFLADTEAEWLSAIDLLAKDPALRQRLGQRGRQLVEQCYSVSRGAHAWAEILAPRSSWLALAA